MKTKFVFLLMTLCISTSIMAQPRVWNFGTNAVLSFNGAPALASSMNTNEGCSIINDQFGNAVFYTDGISVWNGAGVLQTGVTVAGPLMGQASATQAAIIIPVTCSDVDPCTKYFIFTVDDVENDYVASLRVSLATVTGIAPNTTVTITAADINVPLLTAPGGVLINVSEKLTATSDGAGGYWVAVHGIGLYNCAPPVTCWAANPNFTNCAFERNFYFIHVLSTTCTIHALIGTNTPVITQAIGNALRDGGHPYPNGGCPGFNGQGQMKFNQAGNQLAITFHVDRVVQVYDFAAGVLSNLVTLDQPNGCFAANEAEVYGLEFSPNGRYLYVASTWTGSQNIYQYDLNAVNPCVTQVTLPATPTGQGYEFGCLQLGPDLSNNGTLDIYVARTNQTFLDVIRDPDIGGLGCNYTNGGAPLNAGTCQLGLPTLLLNSPCEGDSTQCKECQCNNDITITDFSIDADGNSGLTLNVGPGSIDPVSKFRITLINYHSTVDEECLKCDVHQQEAFGDIVGVGMLYGTSPVFGPYSPFVTANFSREVTWCFNPTVPNFQPPPIGMKLKFPPVLNLACCKNGVEFCFRVEIWGKECRACDKLVCYSAETNGNKPERKPMVPSEIIPDKKVSQPQGNMKAVPNPAQNNFDLKVSELDVPGDVSIYDSHGALVKQSRITGETSQIDTKGLMPGIYLIKYKSATKSYQEKIIISK